VRKGNILIKQEASALEEGSQDQPIRSAQEALVAEEKGSDVARGAIDNSEDMRPHVFVGGRQRKVDGMVH
jgi:hypothetical protein